MSNDKKPKPSLAAKIIYAILVILILMMFWPASRTFLQRSLIKTGLYKPKVEQPTAETTEGVNEASPTKGETAVFINEKATHVHTDRLKGKVVFINFWATWCGPCIAEMPSIQTLHDAFKDNDDIEFMLVEVDGDMEVAQQFMRKHNLSMPVYVPGGDIPKEWLSGAIPSTIVLDKEGERVFSHRGMADYSDPQFIEFIRQIAEE